MDSVLMHTKYLWILFIIITCFCGRTISDMGKLSSSSSQNHLNPMSSSHFTTKNNTRVIAQKGGLAILPCAVKLSSPATVSWIRRRDFQLLTVGLSTHSSDGRFFVEHTRHMGYWSLRIKSVREEDRGLYECQLSIYPTQSIFVELRVVEAIAEISGAPDLHIDEGSALRLECKLKRATENPSFVFWYHDNKMVNYDSQDGFSVTSTSVNMPSSSHYNGNGVIANNLEGSNLTNSLMVVTQSHYLTTPSTSILIIQEVHFHHAGNYTCAPSNARPSSITVHVLRGEKPAAMQHANRSVVEETSKSKATIIKLELNLSSSFKRLLTLLILILINR